MVPNKKFQKTLKITFENACKKTCFFVQSVMGILWENRVMGKSPLRGAAERRAPRRSAALRAAVPRRSAAPGGERSGGLRMCFCVFLVCFVLCVFVV